MAMLTLLLLAAGAAEGQESPDGRTQWTTTYCVDCHGPEGQGGFGPDLAGRQLSWSQFRRAVRQPWGIMPAYTEGQMPDARLRTIFAYLTSLPQVSEPAPPRFSAPPGSPVGQVVMIGSGCGQCHEAEMATPRRALGREASTLTFEHFSDIVYRHTDHYPGGRMGNYSPDRLPPERLRVIYDFMLSLGLRASLSARLERAGTGAYRLTLENQGRADSGLAAEGITVRLKLPTGVQPTRTSQEGYGGVTDGAATWSVGLLAAGQKRTFEIEVAADTPDLFKDSRVTWRAPAPRRLPGMSLRSPVIPESGDEVMVTLPASR